MTRVGGLPEVVREGETGLVVERDDPPALAAALARLLASAALRRRLGGAGRAWVQAEYEWSDSVARMVEVYHGLTTAGRCRLHERRRVRLPRRSLREGRMNAA